MRHTAAHTAYTNIKKHDVHCRYKQCTSDGLGKHLARKYTLRKLFKRQKHHFRCILEEIRNSLKNPCTIYCDETQMGCTHFICRCKFN